MIEERNPKEIAIELHLQGFPVLKYMELQKERQARIKTFEEAGIPFLVEEAKKLFEFGEEVVKHMKILNICRFMRDMQRDSVEWMDTRYYYEYRPAKDGEICLATTDPKLFCNGIYTFSSKDPGDGMAYVVVATDKDEE